MANYSVYLPPDGIREHVRFLRDGKSLLALLLPPVFLIIHRLWFALGIYILVVAALGLAGMVAGPVTSFFLSLLPGLYLFVDGGQLVRGRLERGGWREVIIVSGNSVSEAELHYFGNFGGDTERPRGMPAPRSDPSPAARPAGESGLGIFN